MARGISIKDVENKVQNINDNNVLPISTGADVPEVVEVGTLKEHIQEGLDFYEKPSAGIPKSDLAADVRTSLGKADTALQSFTETDPTVPAWAKQSSKPSYSYSEITGKPTLSAVATSGSYNDLTNKPDIPSEQIQSDWNQSNDSSKDYIKNKPDIGATYTAAWTANSSAAVGVALTDDLTLPKGIYLVRVGFPVLSKALAAANLAVGGAATRDTNIYYSGSSYFSGFEIVTVGDGGGTVHLQVQASTSITYTYKERGGLVAIKFV